MKASLAVVVVLLAACSSASTAAPEAMPPSASSLPAAPTASPPQDVPPLVDPPGGRAVSYGPDPLQRLDLFVPEGAGPHPLVLWLHGGGWLVGDKADLPFRDLVEQGVVVASANYRSALTEWPATFEDPGLALAAVLDDVEADVDPDRVVVAGFSAGAHLAALLALSGEVPVAGIMSFAGPQDLRDLTNVPGDEGLGPAALVALLLDCPPAECPERVAAASPVTLVDADAPPAYVQVGSEDQLVAAAVGQAFAAAFDDSGVPVDLEVLDGIGHQFVRTDGVDDFLVRVLASR